MIKKWYGAILCWLMRPALEQFEEKTWPNRKRKVQEAVFDGIVGCGSKDGMIATALHSAYGLERD